MRRLKNMIGTSEPAATRARSPKAKMPCPSRKKSRFSGKKQAEAGEVHLLQVFLNLGEIGVDGEVGGEARGEAVLDVDPGEWRPRRC